MNSRSDIEFKTENDQQRVLVTQECRFKKQTHLQRVLLTSFKDAFGGQRRDHPVDELLQQQTMEHLKITVPALNRDLETLCKRDGVVNSV